MLIVSVSRKVFLRGVRLDMLKAAALNTFY